MIYYEIPWFYQEFKNEDLALKSALSSRSENTGPVYPNKEQNTFTTLKAFSSCRNSYNIS